MGREIAVLAGARLAAEHGLEQPRPSDCEGAAPGFTWRERDVACIRLWNLN